MAIFAALLLILFGGVTDRLIPLFAVGAFLAFTLSQAGMVEHWRKAKSPAVSTKSGAGKGGAGTGMLVNGLGALATGLTVIVIIVAKFTEGAWVVVVLLPLVLLFMSHIRRHYQHVEVETTLKQQPKLSKSDLRPPVAIVPVDRWNAATEKALRFAMTLSPDVQAVHVTCDADQDRPDL